MDPRTCSQEASLLKPFNPPHLALPIHPSRSPQCRPLSFAPQSTNTDVETLDGLDAPQSCLPLVLHCKICLRITTWYNPMDPQFERNPSLDVLPSLSISSHSTSSEPSSIGTDFFSSLAMPPSPGSPYAQRVSAKLDTKFFASDGCDATAPVVVSQESAVSGRQASSRIKSWVGGGVEGVCSSCYSLNTSVAPGATTSLELPRSRQNYSLATAPASERNSDKLNPSPPSSHLPRRHSHVGPTSWANSSHAHATGHPTELQPPRPAPHQLPSGVASSLPKHPSLHSSNSVNSSGVQGFLSNEQDVLCYRSNRGLCPTSESSSHVHERPGASLDAPSLPRLPIRNTVRDAESVKSSPIIRSRKKAAPTMADVPSTTDLPSGGSTTQREVVASDPSQSLRQEVVHRGTNLRTLLREAKIPPPDSEDLNTARRRHPTTVDKWQAAMIATPRDHLRQGDFSTWQLYGTVDTPFYQRVCGLSASTTSLSGKETLLSAASVTSFRDSLDPRSVSPMSEHLPPHENPPPSRRPSRGREPTSDTLVTQTSSEFSPPSSDTGRYISAPSTNESQEILSGTALAKPPRHSPSNVGLIARITNIHSSGSKIDRGFKRRPNTATGTTQSSSVVQSSPKPGPHGLSTPSPHTGAPHSLLPSLFLAGSKAPSAGSRDAHVTTCKRPATATCPGTRTTELTSSPSRDFLATRPSPVQKLSTGKLLPTAYAPTLPTILGRPVRNNSSHLTDDPQQDCRPARPLEIRPPTALLSESSNSSRVSPVSASPPSHHQSRHGSPVQLSQSVPNFLLKTRFPTPKRNAFYATNTLAVTSDQLTDPDSKDPHLSASPWLQPEDYQSKSRNFVLSVLPRPTTATFAPGQKLSVHLKLTTKVKVRKYTAIYLMLIGNSTSENASQTPAHDFLRHNYLIYPNPSEEVKIISNSGDLSEWHLELNLPEYANCACAPGPLPLPSTGVYAATKVSYSLQLYADRKQLLSTQESLSVSLNVATRAEARYQVTTQSLRTIARKGRVLFSGGYLGSIDELSLSHQVYYQSADRLRLGYQFELQLSPNSFLPPSVAEEVSKATKIQLNTLMRLQTKEAALKYVDHRSLVTILPPGEKDGRVKWIIKGFLEIKAVAQQMNAVKAALESTPRTPRRRENTLGSRSMLTSSHGPGSMGVGGPGSCALGSSTTHSLQQETERLAKFNGSQLFLLASIDHCPSVLNKPLEVSSLIGNELLSLCSLRKLGDEVMKKQVMAEKMIRVQEENYKNLT